MGYSVFIGKERAEVDRTHSWSIGFTEHSEIFSKLDCGGYPLLSQIADYHKVSVFWGTEAEDLLREVESFICGEGRGGAMEALRVLVMEASSKGLPLCGRSDFESVS